MVDRMTGLQAYRIGGPTALEAKVKLGPTPPLLQLHEWGDRRNT